MNTNSSIKTKTIRGLAWSAIDKLAYELIQFSVGIVMARLLLPSDYGLVGIMLVFMSFSTLFIDGGMTTALVQKTNRTNEDFNTAFLYNFSVSIFFYFILFFSAPLISEIYNNSDITKLLRVLALNLIIVSFSSVQNTKLTILVDFKSLSIISIVSGVVSGAMGVGMALKGYGVWSLVVQQLTSNLCKTVLLNITLKWMPVFSFSKKSFKELFGFGVNLMGANILARIYDNLYPLIIGKLFPFKMLGYYSRAHQYAVLPENILKQMFMRVTYPVMSSIKEDSEKLRTLYRKYIEMSSFVIFPIMFLVAVLAKPIILVMLTDKWEPAVPFLQILCMGVMFQHISSINLNLLYVKGRSDLALRLELIKKTVAVTILVLSTLGGIWWICIGQAIYSVIAVFLNSFYTKKLIEISFKDQFVDFGKVWLIAFVTAIPSIALTFCIEDSIIQLCAGFLLYILLYITLNLLFHTTSYVFCMKMLKNYLRKPNNIR